MSTVRYCVVCGVNNKENQETLFSFPKCPIRRDKWLEILKIQGIVKSTARVCESHFNKNQLVRNYLKKDALPTTKKSQTSVKSSIARNSLNNCQPLR